MDVLILGALGIAALYVVPVATFGLLSGMEGASPLALPPTPPTRDQSRRRARYFEDIQ